MYYIWHVFCHEITSDALILKCSVSCGQGMQVRSAKCVDSDGNEKTLEECDAVTPRLTKQTCQVDECPHWESGQWNSVSFIITQVSQQNVERNYISVQFSAPKNVVLEKKSVRFGVNMEIKL